jgi:hypothetical protein
MYNLTIHKVEKEKQKVNFYGIRNRTVPAKAVPVHKNWLLSTPKDIRAESVHDAVSMYKSAFSNLRAGNIRRFTMRYRSRKREPVEYMNIPRTAAKPSAHGNAIHVFKRFMKSPHQAASRQG